MSGPYASTGVIGIPSGIKQAGKRADFKEKDFELQIEMHGVRIAWSRGAFCPCSGINDQTDQSDPNCAICGGRGFFWFRPTDYVVNEDCVGELDDDQEALVEEQNAVVINGIMTSSTGKGDAYDKIGNWREGDVMFTARHENKLGYYDRVTNLDEEIIFSEIPEMPSGLTLSPRYPITAINLIRTVDTVYTEDDFCVTDGKIVFNSATATPTVQAAPTEGTKVALHYLCRPVWVVIDMPHIVRATKTNFKLGATPKTVTGNPQNLPIQAHLRLEHFPLK